LWDSDTVARRLSVLDLDWFDIHRFTGNAPVERYGRVTIVRPGECSHSSEKILGFAITSGFILNHSARSTQVRWGVAIVLTAAGPSTAMAAKPGLWSFWVAGHAR